MKIGDDFGGEAKTAKGNEKARAGGAAAGLKHKKNKMWGGYSIST
jgi:hypothetical protein